MRNLPVLDKRAGFVDVGSEHMHVSIAGGEPRVFGTVTSQLHALRDWFKSEGVRSVAMEATGVYWLPLYAVLEDAGLQVCMVNGRQTRSLPGGKTDMQDSQWGADENDGGHRSRRSAGGRARSAHSGVGPDHGALYLRHTALSFFQAQAKRSYVLRHDPLNRVQIER